MYLEVAPEVLLVRRLLHMETKAVTLTLQQHRSNYRLALKASLSPVATVPLEFLPVQYNLSLCLFQQPCSYSQTTE